jgi:hypothetical protein
MPIPVHNTFTDDIARHFAEQLAAEGVAFDDEAARVEALRRSQNIPFNRPHWLCMQWFAVQRKKISPAPRPVRWSLALESKTIPAHHRLALDRIAAASAAGEDLTPYLSKAWCDIGRSDGLLNDWGVHHLHLYPAPQRSKELLYVVEFSNALLFLDLLDHKAFSRKNLVEILQVEAPEVVSEFELTGIREGFEPTEKERSAARHRGVNLLTQIDGKVFMPLGGGQSASGINSEAVRMADYLFFVAGGWARDFEKNADEIARLIAEATGREIDSLTFGLVFDGRRMIAVETQTRVGIGKFEHRF